MKTWIWLVIIAAVAVAGFYAGHAMKDSDCPCEKDTKKADATTK